MKMKIDYLSNRTFLPRFRNIVTPSSSGQTVQQDFFIYNLPSSDCLPNRVRLSSLISTLPKWVLMKIYSENFEYNYSFKLQITKSVKYPPRTACVYWLSFWKVWLSCMTPKVRALRYFGT